MSTGTADAATHYQRGTIQPIQYMQEQMSPDRFIGYLQGNCMKYNSRMERKGTELQDAEKLLQYATWLVQALKGESIKL